MPKTATSVLALKNVDLEITALKIIKNDSTPMLSYQNAATDPTAAIKSGGDQIIPIRVALFLMKKFAPEQFARVVNKSIVGNVAPALKAACTAYYGHPLDLIKKALLDENGFDFDKNAHAALKASENVGFIKTYLDSVIAGKPIAADLDALKKVLGLDVSASAKTKNALVIRTCELLDSDVIEAKLAVDSVKKITEKAGYFKNPEISEAAMRFEILASTLNSDDAKARFSDLYFMLDLAGVDQSARRVNLRGFFDGSLAANAKNNNLVKLVLKLPSEREKYNKKIFFVSKTN